MDYTLQGVFTPGAWVTRGFGELLHGMGCAVVGGSDAKCSVRCCVSAH